ncbi:solute carrier family 35 member F2-like [Panulirus ornatus]|uniref:solute carrier family 35 member F2-like n=1 Tax=Panulirus ornatus TaxID=150431 RepID=UPI003A89470D
MGLVNICLTPDPFVFPRRSVWRALLLGQVASLLLCVTGACCHLLNNTYHLQLPAAVSFINYVLLCLVYTTWLACRSGEGSLLRVVRTKGLKYFVLAAVDVEANYLVLRAYQFTSVTSVQLLDCFVVPVVLALSWLFLKVRYKLVHVLGVGLCLLGVGCLVWANVEDGKAPIPGNSGAERLLGDMLCLGGATLYGISNVAQEYVVKTYDSVEFLGMMGLFGSLINGIQLAILERNDVGSVRWDTWPVLALVGGFSAAQFLFYVVAPAVIRVTSATALNLALFTADFYILITGIALFKFKFHPLYFLSYILVVTGVIVFVIKPTPIASTNRGYYREISVGRSSSGNEVELTTTPGTATSSMGGGASFTEWPPLPPEVRGCPDYPYPHSHSTEFRQGSLSSVSAHSFRTYGEGSSGPCALCSSVAPVPAEYPSTPPSPPQQFRSLPRPARREQYPGGTAGGQRAATLHRPARVRFQLDSIEPTVPHPLPTSWEM